MGGGGRETMNLGDYCDLSTGLLPDFSFHISQEAVKSKIGVGNKKVFLQRSSAAKVQIRKFRHLPKTTV